MSRFVIDPKWLIYVPPTMSPCGTSELDGVLEHPVEAFSYYRHEGVDKVVCQEKHMGSRAVAIVGRDAAVARQRFGVDESQAGVIFTRTGRRFFPRSDQECELLNLIGAAMTEAGLWDELRTDWVCLDCELMPWSAKAQELLRQQYAAVGAAANAALPQVIDSLRQAESAGADVRSLFERFSRRKETAEQFVAAYRRYCWQVDSLADLKLAPFHVLAGEAGLAHAQFWPSVGVRILFPYAFQHR